MRALRLVLAAGLAVAAAPAASAHPTYHYYGGCDWLLVARDPTPGATTRWTGYASVAAVAQTADGVPARTVHIDIACDFYVDGVFYATIIGASGVGAAAGATTWTTDIDLNTRELTACERATVGGEPHHLCHAVVPMPFPEAVNDLVDDMLDLLP